MASINNINNNTNEKIESLWVMGGASVMKDYYTKKVDHYLCYCDNCKKQSVSGEGGIAFQTAEDLLIHRKMEAFICPCGCGFHICKERGSIIRHLDTFHKEVLAMLESEGLDRKKSWIYPDNSNNTYTLNKPMPTFEDSSPMEAAGHILSITPPKRVMVPHSTEKRQKNKFVPLDEKALDKAIPSSKPAPWAGKEQQKASLTAVMEEEEMKKVDKKNISNERPLHYAQEDMRKEEQCSQGKSCVMKDRPFACAFNHDNGNNIIPRGTLLTKDILCEFERPPFMRCGDGRCTAIHLEGRNTFIQKKKQSFFEQSKSSYSNAVGSPKLKRDETAVTMTSDGMHLILSHKDAMEVAAAVKKVEQQMSDEEWQNFEHKKFGDESPPSTTDEEDEEEDNEDLSDPSMFAARYASL